MDNKNQEVIAEHGEKRNFKIRLDKDLLREDDVCGLAAIMEKGDAQQSVFNTVYLIELLEVVKAFKEAGLERIVITVGQDTPIVFGTKEFGYALAPIIE